MGAVTATSILSHWNHMVPGMQQSSADFYVAIERALMAHQLDDVKLERVNMAEGGLLSAKREYLQIRRRDHVFHICAAPFGSGFFVSWWLGEVESGIFAWLSSLPFVGWLFRIFASLAKPITYFRIDTGLMFQSVTHGAVLEALDASTAAKGVRALSELERKPVMRDFFGQLGGK